MVDSITILSFDNRPFTRTLTARAEGLNNSDTIKWIFPSNVFAQTTALATYTSNSAALASQVRTLIFSFSASTYDYTTTSYTLCALQLSCTDTNTALTAITSITFDTFPNIDLTLFINYERTNSNSYFYRLTSTQPYGVSSQLAPYFINLTSTSYNLVSALSASTYNTWYSLNDTSTRLTNLAELTGFVRTPQTRLSSVQATLSATSAPGSLSAFWTSHILTRSLSAVFVPYFLSGNFIGYPRGYFSSLDSFDILTPATISQNSPGMRFYGEGHTETILLSSGNVATVISTLVSSTSSSYTTLSAVTNIVTPQTVQHVWRLDNSVTRYPVSSTLVGQPLTSVSVRLTSQPDFYPVIPISLHLTNSLFLSTDPIFYYDDITGQPTYYPYYTSTINVNGIENTPRNKLKESIRVLPYIPLDYIFTPGIQPTIYLPSNESRTDYTSILQTSFVDQISSLDPRSIDPCYGLYGQIWNWLSFTGCSSDPTSFSRKPSSWETTSLTATFPKRWEYQAPLSADLSILNPASCSATNITWLLSTQQTKHIDSAQIPKSYNTFNFSLALKNGGGEQYVGSNGGVGITLDKFNTTNVLLSVHHTVQCLISTQFSSNATALGYTNDWKLKTTDIDIGYNIVSNPINQAVVYTPNRFVLTGVDVKFENLFTIVQGVTSVVVDFDDNKFITLTGDNIFRDFSTTYNIEGFKTLRITFNNSGRVLPDVYTFPNIIRVLNEYDQVSPTEYRSTLTPLALPWSNKPQIGSNDWAVEDNINHWFRKFFENLEYLETRSRTYEGTFSDYFGYYGPIPTQTERLTSCEIWTWEDLDCFNTTLPEPVTWRDVLSAENLATASGKYVNQGCGTWQSYECTYEQVSPTCYGLHDVEWSWRLRKKENTLTPITWKQTNCPLGIYKKTWKYQPPLQQPILVCSPGLWHVNLPGLNEYYSTPINTRTESRCIYYGIASRNNILYIAQKKQIRLLQSNREATFFDYEDTIDEVVNFSSIKNICLDSTGKIYILDNLRSQVTVYNYEQDTLGRNFKLFTIWGGFGSAKSNSKFSSPNDLHIDQLDNIWVTDTGNGCVKQYSNTGYWIRTIIDDTLKKEIPLSTAVDSQKNVHILTKESIRVYTYTGEFLFSYGFKEHITGTPRKINSSYNKEIIYFASDTQVLKYFRNGVFFGYIIKDRTDIDNITSVYHDEYRNLLITSNDKILKYPDVMTLKQFKGDLPNSFWNLEDILIHKEEYVQNWVYTKAFQRMWDNIEIFRNTIFYNNTRCKGYKPPIHGKEKMIIGQNEIVTSTVINRVLGYLWDNLNTMLDYFDPSCEEIT